MWHKKSPQSVLEIQCVLITLAPLIESTNSCWNLA